jgi:NAD(P)-dependent dehydrogenase (short-subunit alcohol dehydrogenase family)
MARDLAEEFKGHIAVVTGGASGIGEGCARRLSEGGATVIIADLNLKKAKEVAASINGHAMEVDVADEKAVDKLAADCEDNIGPIDSVITSAGVLQPPLSPDELPLETWDKVMDVDFRGTYLTCRAFGTRMANRGAGSIVTIASITSGLSVPLHAYAPAKSAVIALTRTLAAEWGRSGVRVNAISPGATWTAALEEAVAKGERNVKALEEVSCLGRLLKTSEIGDSAAFLCSDQASGITGTELIVDAGWIAGGAWHAYFGIRPPRSKKA